MSTKIPLIVSYQIGDGYTFTATEVVPVLADSKQAFLEAFDLAMAAYEPDGVERFCIEGQLFEYRHFIEWTSERITPRRTKETYEAYRPTVLTVEEWTSRSLEHAGREALLRRVNVVSDGHVNAVEPLPAQ